MRNWVLCPNYCIKYLDQGTVGSAKVFTGISPVSSGRCPYWCKMLSNLRRYRRRPCISSIR